MARSRLAFALALALLAPAALAVLSGGAPPARAAGNEEPYEPEGQNWLLEPRTTPGEGFEVTTRGTVEDQPARIERRFDLDNAELTVRYRLGEEAEPTRQLEAHLRLTGVYVFEDDGNARLDADDRVLEHRRVDQEGDAYVTPVRSEGPLSSMRAVVPLEDTGRVALTLTTTSDLAMVRGSQITPTESRLNVTATGLSAQEDRHVALAVKAEADDIRSTSEGLLRLEGQGAGLVLDSHRLLDDRTRGSAGASVFEDARNDGQALILLSGPSSGLTGHDLESNVVHTSTGLEEVAGAVRGQAGPFLLGLLGASALVGWAAWRKLNA